MQTFTDPTRHCSTVMGRSLLEWYYSMEAHCCFSAGSKPLLPVAWRDTSVRIRQALAHEEYPLLSSEERTSRLLGDLWAQLKALNPKHHDIQEAILLLKTLEGQARLSLATRLE